MKSIMFFLPFIFAVITSCTKESVPVTNNEPVPATVNKTVLLQLVNDARKKGCNCGNTYYAPAPALTWNDQLEKAAYLHVNDLYQKKYFSHTGSDGSGSGERINAVGYSWKFYGENIAAGYQTEKEVISGWLSSSGHCANIM
ncbi:MAG TPA: CAP domain-containing protein, partial [Flavisolibacter sp.]|nr:CAP domain-containing protein [Flavisolibacter sp.]